MAGRYEQICTIHSYVHLLPFDPHRPRAAINLISAIIQLHELPFNILSSMQRACLLVVSIA